MAYEIGSKGGERLNVPNPLRVENQFLLGTAGVLVLVALVLLVLGRGNATAHAESFIGSTVVSLGLLAAGIGLAAMALTHLRFFFGREEPSSLGDSAKLRELLRQRALEYPVPSGPLNGLLYSWVDQLIYAPQPVQELAQMQFRNAATMASLLVSLILTMTLGKTGVDADLWQSMSGWIGLGFMALAMYLLVGQRGIVKSKSSGLISRNNLVFLLVFSVAGPVVLSFLGAVLPQQSWIDPYPGVFVILMAAIGTYWLFFHALMGQLQSQPQTEVSVKQQAWNIHCQPGQIMGELDRVMQETWTEAIPNRRYIWVEPKVNLNTPSGTFYGEALEETQPMPVESEPLDFQRAWSNPVKKRLVMLDIAGSALGIIGALLLSVFAYRAGHSEGTFLAYGIAFIILGFFAFRAAQKLWLRFDFESRVQWMTIEGNYVAAAMELGNVLNDTVKTKSQMVQIESMTFRLWASRLRTVTFGKGAARHVIEMTGESEFVESLAQRLMVFSQNQASIVAPDSMANMERHARLARMNQASRAAAATPPQIPATPAVAEIPAPLEAIPAAPETQQAATVEDNSCPDCKNLLEAGDAFCRHCGSRLLIAGII